MSDEEFLETTGSFARAVGVLPDTIRLYAKEGLLPHIVVGRGGMRLFRRIDVPLAKEIVRERLARRGRWREAQELKKSARRGSAAVDTGE